MDWNLNTLIAAVALVIAAGAALMKSLDKGLSLREHEAFKETIEEFKESIKSQLEALTQHQNERVVIREFNDWRTQMNSDLDKVESDIKTIELTRPSSGELKMATEAVSARLAIIEDLVKTVLLRNGGGNAA